VGWNDGKTTLLGLVVTSFAFAIATAIGLESMPTEDKPNSRAAKLVVPLPQNGSSTHSFVPALSLRMFSGNDKGYIV
jgi:hypothetical protein